MATSSSGLAEEVRKAMVFPLPISKELIGWATGVLNELTGNGTATARIIPGPHSISGMTGGSMADKVVQEAGYPNASKELKLYCGAIVAHIQGSGQVFYIAPIAAPPAIQPADAWFLGGTISGLNGPILAGLIAKAVGYPGVSARLLAKATAIVDHIQNNAEVTDGVIS